VFAFSSTRYFMHVSDAGATALAAALDREALPRLMTLSLELHVVRPSEDGASESAEDFRRPKYKKYIRVSAPGVRLAVSNNGRTWPEPNGVAVGARSRQPVVVASLSIQN
jgi:hypothetical protein